MTWEEKLAALKALTPTHLEMRKPGDWYVAACSRETKVPGHCMLSGTYGNGKTPQEAVEDDWAQITAPGHDVIIDAMDPAVRRKARWNGSMWEITPDPFVSPSVARSVFQA